MTAFVKLYILIHQSLQDARYILSNVFIWDMGREQLTLRHYNGRLLYLRYLKNLDSPPSVVSCVFHENWDGFCLSNEFRDSLQIMKFSPVQVASLQLTLIREQRHIRGSEEIAFNSCFNGSLLGTEPVEVPGTARALELSSLEFHRTARVTVQYCQVQEVCFGAHSPEKNLSRAMFCRSCIWEEFTFLSRNLQKWQPEN